MALDDDRKPGDAFGRPTAPRELKPAPKRDVVIKAPAPASTGLDSPFGGAPLDDVDIAFDLIDEDEAEEVDIFDRDTKIPSLPSEELAAEAMRRLDGEDLARESAPVFYEQSGERTLADHRPAPQREAARASSLLDELSPAEPSARKPPTPSRDSEPSWRDVLSSAPPAPRSEPLTQRRSNSLLDFADHNAKPVHSAAPAAGFAPASPKPVAPGEPSVQEMQERYALGDFTRALELAEAILQKHPDDTTTRRYAQNCRDVLTQMFAARIGPLDQVMSVVISPQEVQWLSLDHRAGFLLSLVDGQSTVDEILDISGMSRLDALKIIHQLVEQQVVSLA